MFNPVKMFRLLLISILFLQIPLFAEAKSAKASGVASKSKKQKANLVKIDAKKLKVSFDANYYYQLNFKNRKAYLQEIQELAENLSKKSKGKKSSTAWLDQILFDDAHADQACFSGGIPYRAATCGTLPDTFAISDTSIYGCAADQQRCSLAFGLDTGGKTLCYSRTNENEATSKCIELSDATTSGKTAIDRLNEQLTRCEFIRSSEARCATLVASVERDTRALDGECAIYRGVCNSSKERIARLHPSIARGAAAAAATPAAAAAVAGVDDGCGAAEQRLAEQMLSEQFDTSNVNKKWLKLVSLSAQSCGTNLDLESQLRKFGACTLPSSSADVEADIRNDQFLQSAVLAVGSRGAAVPSGSASDAFKNYFGIGTSEFTSLFCGTAAAPSTTQSFYVGGRALTTPRVAGTAPLDDPRTATNEAATYETELNRRVRNSLFSGPSFESVRAGMPASDAKSLLQDYHRLRTEREMLQERMSNCNGCSDRVAREDALRTHSGDYNLQELRARVERDFPSTRDGLERTLGAANYQALRQSAGDREIGVNATSPNLARDREQFKSCVENAIARTEDSAGNNIYTANFANRSPRVGDRRNRNCTRQLVDDLSNPPRDSRNFLIRIATSPTDNMNYACHSTNGNWVGPNVSRLSCSKAVQLEGSGRYACIDNRDSYIAYTYSCRNATGSDLDQTDAERADAIAH